MNLHEQGTISLWLQHQHTDWPTNSHGYNFPKAEADGVSLAIKKQPDKTIEAILIDTQGASFTFRQPAPQLQPKGIHVVVSWDKGDVKLYLNGQLAQEGTASSGP